MPRISVIIPAYNEEEGIVSTVKEVREATRSLDAEIIVVDDGSTDKTAERAQELADKLVRHATNRGKGAAMRSGFEAASGEYLIFLDADGTYPAKFIPKMVQKLAEVDAVFTCRTNKEHIPFLNRLGNWLITKLIKKFSGFVGNDPLSGLYGLRRNVVEAIGLESSTFAIETEIVVKVSGMRFTATEIPITYRPRLGSSKLRPLRDGWRILRMVIDLLFIFRPFLTFTLPGLIISTAGLILVAILSIYGSISLDGVRLSLHTFLTGLALTLLGTNAVTYGSIIDLYAVRHRFKKPSRITRFLTRLSLYRNLRNLSLLILVISIPTSAYQLFRWVGGGFGPFTATRTWMLSLTGLLLGLQGVFASIIGRIFAKDCLWVNLFDRTVDTLGPADRQYALREGEEVSTSRQRAL
jgi:glycosyltransferase involved in cell wall biosynthesis